MSRMNIRDWVTENAYRDIMFELPGIMERNEWLAYMYQSFQEAEDPSIRNYGRNFPASSEMKARAERDKGMRGTRIGLKQHSMSELNIPPSKEYTKLSLIEMMDESNLRVFWLVKRRKEEYE